MPRLTLRELEKRLWVLESEAAIRKLQATYMMLCDTPCPVFPPIDDAERIERIVALYTPDAVWEGVGEFYEGQFGQAVGRDEICSHFGRFWAADRTPGLLLNAHYLTTERIEVEGEKAQGHWIHMQPWLFSDGSAVLRSSRLNNSFEFYEGEWMISRTRTENVFISDLPKNFATAYPKQSVLFE